jgi:hypothetical protein
MGGVGVAEGVDGDILFSDCCLELGFAESALDGGFGHGGLGLRGPFAISSKSREKKCRMSVSEPMLTQELEGGVRQGEVTILGSFATVDVDHHALAVDVGDFQVLGFLESEPT